MITCLKKKILFWLQAGYLAVIYQHCLMRYQMFSTPLLSDFRTQWIFLRCSPIMFCTNDLFRLSNEHLLYVLKCSRKMNIQYFKVNKSTNCLNSQLSEFFQCLLVLKDVLKLILHSWLYTDSCQFQPWSEKPFFFFFFFFKQGFEGRDVKWS